MSERPTLFCNTGINQQMLVTFFRIYLYDISGDFQLIIFILIEKKNINNIFGSVRFYYIN